MLEGVCLQEDLVTIFIQELAPFSLQDSLSAFGFLLSCFHKLYQSIATSASSVGGKSPGFQLSLLALFFLQPIKAANFSAKFWCWCSEDPAEPSPKQAPTALQAELSLASSLETERWMDV